MSLPNGWASAPIDSLGDVKLGKMLDKSKNQGSPAKYLRNINVRWFDFDLSDLNTILASAAELASLSVQDDDLFVCEGGEPGRCAVWHGGDTGLVFQKALHRFRSNGSVAPEYLMYRLRHDAESGVLGSVLTGTTIKHFTRESFLRYVIPLAPRAEQQRIADKLDALLARVDACRTRLDRVPAILKRFREAVLEAATRGVLSEGWRVAQGRTDDWAERTLPELGELARGKSRHRPRDDARLYNGPYPFIQTGAVAQSGGWITAHTQTYSEFGLAQSKLWPKGTVCITIAANIADTALLTYAACFPDSVVGFIPDPERCVGQFVKWSIDVIRDQLEAFAPATAQKNINLDVLRAVRISCPQLDEQVEIVRRVDSLFALADALQARYEAARARVERLTPALLAKAFRGELVPQDPSDEPAAALLERLRAAPPAATSTRPRKAAAAPARRRRASGRDRTRT